MWSESPHKTDRALGKLYGSKYKKDVAVWAGLGKYDGPPRVAFTIKHLTKTKYIYGVSNKFYLCVYDFWRKPHKVPNSAWVIYLKAFPRISYLSDDENCIGAFDFCVKAICILGIAIAVLDVGITFLAKV